MTLFANRYRVESARHPLHDYSLPGWYHVTICVADMLCVLGTIRDGQMIPSAIGEIAQRHLEEVPEHFRHVRLNEYALMPNHVHALFEFVGELRLNEQKSHRSRAGSLGAVVGAYKASVTHWCKQNRIAFGWQPRFYDQVLRSGPAIRAIQRYIRLNVLNWAEDEFNKECETASRPSLP